MPTKNYTRLIQTYLLSLAFFLLAADLKPLYAESFTATAVHTLNPTSTTEKKSVFTSISDVVEIILPKDQDYVQGIEIDLKLPQKTNNQYEKLTWSLYTLSSEDGAGTFSGNRIAMGSFGIYLSLVLKVPISPTSQIKRDAYSYYIPNTSGSYGEKLLIRIQGSRTFTEEEQNAYPIEVSAKPIFIEKSRLFINLKPPSGREIQPCTVFVDGKPCTPSKAGLLVSPGIHDISVTSDFYRNELRTVTVESAKDTQVNIALRDIAPLLRIIAPEGTKIFVDERPIANNQTYFTLPQGGHTLRLRLGNYEIVRGITIQNGRSYSVNLSLEASITEEE